MELKTNLNKNQKITRKKLIKKYIEFFKSKGHSEIQNSPLIPENDATVLFTTAGMHPLVPYLLGQPHPKGKRLVNFQKCFRTTDIEEVGDQIHHTFFEMLGNWSLGDYFKEQAIKFTFEFLTKELKIPSEKLAATCFKGDLKLNIPKDIESEKIWNSLGIPKQKIIFLDKEDNWWGPAGNTGPCGPDTEIFYWTDKENIPEKYDPNNKNWVEIGNNVLMQYYKNEKGEFNTAKQKNIDFGGGVERTIAILQGYNDNYLTEVWQPIIKQIEKISRKTYGENKEQTKSIRIIADHIKASCFIIADNITPSNSEQGYILRRIIRRAIRHSKLINIPNKSLSKIAEPVFEIYDDYTHLQKNKNKIIKELEKEEEKFLQTLEKGLKEFKKLSKNNKEISGKDAFLLYQSYGFPIEMTQELAKEKKLKVNLKEFESEQKKHQNISRTATKGKFSSGLADNSEQTTKLHTATHLLHAALREVLGTEVQQKGSNITPERLRFDFMFNRKLTEQEIKKIENIINEKINESLEVTKQEMSPEQAKKSGALGFFEHKYGEIVSVYTIINPKTKQVFSKEICTGPHVKNTLELKSFKILKEESSSAGIRRIKAIIG